MSKSSFLQWIVFIVLVISPIKMIAQEIKTTSNELSAMQQSLVLISAFTSSGQAELLKEQLNKGLDAGLSINEIKEALVQLYAYCGFPRSLNALNAFKTVLEERKSKGITDKVGKEIVVENPIEDKYEQGRKVLEILTQITQQRPAPGFGEFAPRADAFLKEHLFADIFSSDVLSYQQRELVTISTLAAMSGVEPQLQAHIAMGKNTGITQGQLTEVAELIEKNISQTQANTVRKIIGGTIKAEVDSDIIIRIAEIEIIPEFADQYKTIVQEAATTSIQNEHGVIAIFPMWQRENPNQIRIIEIYANHSAYQSHLQSAHFKYYKTTTIKMIKSLKLVDMSVLDIERMKDIFNKL